MLLFVKKTIPERDRFFIGVSRTSLQFFDFYIPEPDIISMILQRDFACLILTKSGHVLEFADGYHFVPVLIPKGRGERVLAIHVKIKKL